MKSTICPSVHSNKQLSPVEAAYCAGLIDGEGCLTIIRTKRKESRSGFRYMADFTIANTNLDLLRAVYQMFGNGRIVKAFTTSRHSPLRRDCYVINFQSNQIRQVLPQLLPYLVGKRRQAEILLEHLTVAKPNHVLSVDEWSHIEQLRAEIRQLNRRSINREVPVDPPLVLRPCRWKNQWGAGDRTDQTT